MDEIKDRLKQAADACAKAYDTWRAKTTEHSSREALMETVHELRKVAARLEIELAVADRQQNPNDPIPIPSHRAAGRGRIQQGPADDIGNTSEDSGNRGNRGDRGSSRPVSTPRPPRNPDDEGGVPVPGSGKPLSLKRSSSTDSE